MSVVVHTSLKDTDLMSILRSRYKSRVSDTLIEGSVIFPVSSVAFLLLEVGSCTVQPGEKNLRMDLMERLSRFSELHRKCYLLLCAPMFCEHEKEIFRDIQIQFLTSRLRVFPVHNLSEAVEIMHIIAEGQLKPNIEKKQAEWDQTVQETTEEAIFRFQRLQQKQGSKQSGVGTKRSTAQSKPAEKSGT